MLGLKLFLFFIPWGKMGSVVKLLRLFVICQLDGFDCYQILPSKMYSIIPCALKTTDIYDQWISLLSSFKNLLFCWFLTSIYVWTWIPCNLEVHLSLCLKLKLILWKFWIFYLKVFKLDYSQLINFYNYKSKLIFYYHNLLFKIMLY